MLSYDQLYLQLAVVSIGEKQIDLTDMITKDGKLKKKKPKKQLSPEEIKEKLRKLRGKSCCIGSLHPVATLESVLLSPVSHSVIVGYIALT